MVKEQDRPLGIVHIQTPFRISFFGGGTDLEEYFKENKGAVLGTTLNRYSYVVLNSLVRLLSKRIKLSYSQLEYANDPDELQHGITRCILKEYPHLWNGNFLDVHSFADIPSSSGIGSSSAFTVGLLQALYAINGQYRSPFHLAKEAINIERYKLKDKGGWQDQIFAAYGGFNRIDFGDGMFHVTPVSMLWRVRKALEGSMMFFFTNIKRSSNDIQRKVFSKQNIENKKTFLKKMYALVDKAEQCLYADDSPEQIVARFGALLDESWQLKRSLSEVISGNHIDRCYETACQAGAYGGKVSGAGGGGFLYFVAPPERHEAIRAAMSEMGVVEVSAGFSSMGSRVIFSEYRR